MQDYKKPTTIKVSEREKKMLYAITGETSFQKGFDALFKQTINIFESPVGHLVINHYNVTPQMYRYVLPSLFKALSYNIDEFERYILPSVDVPDEHPKSDFEKRLEEFAAAELKF